MKRENLSFSVNALDHPNVDTENGIIRDCIVMAEGPIKWDRGNANLMTLESCRDCINERFGEEGFPVLFNPETFNHGEGGIAGAGKNLRIGEKDGKQCLLCDLQLRENFEPRDYLLELAREQPRSLGLSVEYYPEPVNVEGKDYMRCLYFDGAAVVYTPAATPSLYSARGRKNNVDGTTGRVQSRNQLLAFGARKPSLLTFKTK